MIKGVQRRIVEVKLDGSKAYESACFILRQGAGAETKSESELVDEAKRIVGALEPKKRKKAGKIIGKLLLSLLLLVIGCAIGFLLSFALLG